MRHHFIAQIGTVCLRAVRSILQCLRRLPYYVEICNNLAQVQSPPTSWSTDSASSSVRKRSTTWSRIRVTWKGGKRTYRHLRFSFALLRNERQDQSITRDRIRACCFTHIGGGAKVNPLKVLTSVVVSRSECVQISWSRITAATVPCSTNQEVPLPRKILGMRHWEIASIIFVLLVVLWRCWRLDYIASNCGISWKGFKRSQLWFNQGIALALAPRDWRKPWKHYAVTMEYIMRKWHLLFHQIVLAFYGPQRLCNHSVSSGTVWTTWFNILKLCTQPTQCIYVLRTVLTINSDCFLNNINWLVFVTEM
jgi:hypothetical protein